MVDRSHSADCLRLLAERLLKLVSRLYIFTNVNRVYIVYVLHLYACDGVCLFIGLLCVDVRASCKCLLIMMMQPIGMYT